MQPGDVVLDPKMLRKKTEFAISPRLFLTRWLRNLKGIYVNRRDFPSILTVVHYLR